MYGLYARQSVEKQDSISVESQLEFCRFEIKGQAFRTYIDRGFSGKDTRRPGFEALMEDIRRGEIQAVVVYKLDRISRSIVDFSNMMEVFQSYGVSFISSTEKFDTSTPIGRAMLNLCAVFAQLERETIQKRVSDAYRSRSQKGFYMGGRVPFGFRVEQIKMDGISTSRYQPVKEEIRWVKEMFSFYAQQEASLGELAQYLKELGAVNRQGKAFCPARLGELIRNPVYVKADGKVYQFFRDRGVRLLDPPGWYTGERGCYLYQEEKGSKAALTGCLAVLAPHRGIVDSDTWLACRRKCLEHRRAGPKGTEKSSWLVGKVACGICGSSLAVRKKGEGGTRYFEELTSQAAGAGKALMGYLSQKAEELERKKYSLEKNLEHKTTLKRGKTPQSLAEALTVWNMFSNQEKSLVADSVIEKITIFKDKAEFSWRY